MILGLSDLFRVLNRLHACRMGGADQVCLPDLNFSNQVAELSPEIGLPRVMRNLVVLEGMKQSCLSKYIRPSSKNGRSNLALSRGKGTEWAKMVSCSEMCQNR